MPFPHPPISQKLTFVGSFFIFLVISLISVRGSLGLICYFAICGLPSWDRSLHHWFSAHLVNYLQLKASFPFQQCFNWISQILISFSLSFTLGYYNSNLISSLIHRSFINTLFNLQLRGHFLVFFLLLISSLILLWLKNIFRMISVLWNLLRLSLWLSMCSVLVNVPFGLQKNVFSEFLGY